MSNEAEDNNMNTQEELISDDENSEKNTTIGFGDTLTDTMLNSTQMSKALEEAERQLEEGEETQRARRGRKANETKKETPITPKEKVKELEKQLDKMQKDLLNKNKEQANRKKELSELKKENQTLKKDNSDLKKENGDLKKENGSIKKENGDLSKENKRLNGVLTQKDNQIAQKDKKITDTLETLKKLNKLEDDMKEAKETAKEALETNDKLNEEILRLGEKIKEQEEEIEVYLNQAISASNYQEQEEVEEQDEDSKRPAAMFWHNSNGTRILPILKNMSPDIDWLNKDKLYRLKDLREELKYKDKEISQAEIQVIMMALNEIRDKRPASDIAEEIRETVEKLKKSYPESQILYVQVPEVRKPEHRAEAKKLNRILQKMEEEEKTLKVIEISSKLDKLRRSDIFDDSGFHYDPKKKGAEVVANEIKEAVQQATKQKVQLYEIPHGSSAYFIGKGGEHFKRIMKDTETRLLYLDQIKKIKITGEKKNVQHAVQLLNESKNRYSKRAENTKTRTCYWDQQGACKYGDSCSYIHENKKPSNSRDNYKKSSDHTHRDRSPIKTSHRDPSRYNTYRTERLWNGTR